MKTLKDAKVGETVTVAKVHGEGPVRRRIMDMGLTQGRAGLCAQSGAAGGTPWSSISVATSSVFARRMPR